MYKKFIVYLVIIFVSVFLVGCNLTSETTTANTTTNNTTTIQTTTDSSATTAVTTTTNTSSTSTEITEEFVVSFDSNQGSSVSPITIESGMATDLPSSVREGYTFLGWTLTNQPDAEVVTSPFEPDSDITLYAKWSVNQYMISFETDGGSVIEPITQDYGTEIMQPDDPFKDGYLFLGWYLDEELTNPYVFSTMPSNNITIHAKWEAIDWSDVEQYLSNLIPDELSDDISLPDTYKDYTISWESSDNEIISDSGSYSRPYQATLVGLTATIIWEDHSLTKTYDVLAKGYKSLAAPLTSSYIYRDYNMVTDSFFQTLDIINCAFITANSVGTLSGTSVLANINAYIMPRARENGNWVIFSIAPDSDWSAIAGSPTRINTFADNIVNLINQYGFDGVDIDWETPTSEEATHFTNMMRIIYEKVKANNPNHLVTAAIAGGMWQPPRYDLVNSHQYLDYINMMTYGMVSNNGYYQNALSRSTVFDDPTNLAGKTLTSCSIEESVAIYNTYGIPNSKIIVGVAFYGIRQTRTYDSVSQTWSSWVSAGSISYSSISNNYLNNSNYRYRYDTNAGVPYIISTDGTLFISFDNPRSIAEKSEYIINNGLGGMMYWENGLDLTGALLLAMQSGLK